MEKITLDELIKSDIADKNIAVLGYDGILWKIRSGYILIIYGSLSIMAGNHEKISLFSGENFFICSLLMIIGFSLATFWIDRIFLRDKLKVVEALDKLMGYAFKRAKGDSFSDEDLEGLNNAFKTAGESSTKVNWEKYPAWRPLVIIYGGTACIASVIFIISKL